MLYLLSAAPMLCCNVAAAQYLSAAPMQLCSFVYLYHHSMATLFLCCAATVFLHSFATLFLFGVAMLQQNIVEMRHSDDYSPLQQKDVAVEGGECRL